MKKFSGYCICFLVLLCCPMVAMAQEVKLRILFSDIINRQEINREENTLKAETESWLSYYPTFKSLNQNYQHEDLQAILRPEVLRWQLSEIRDQTPSQFDPAGTLPPYRYFTTTDQTWFEPSRNGRHQKGDVSFNFKIPSSEYASNAFRGGKYVRNIIHNYTKNEFDPVAFDIILEVDDGMIYLIHEPVVNIDIISLNEYRSSSSHIIGDLGFARIVSTLDYNLKVETDKKEIKFTSPSENRNIDISMVSLGSTNANIVSLPLWDQWTNHTPSPLEVEIGNRNDFRLQLIISASNFLTHFYKPGTYTFKMKQEIKSTDGSEREEKQTEVTIKVPALSEIVIPSNGNEVNFIFNTDQLYNEGQSKVMQNQLRVSNNESYELYVKSDASFFKASGIQSDIPSKILQLGVVGGLPSVVLSTNSQKIINQSPPVLDRNLNIQYTIPASAAQRLKTKEKDTYSINVIYSFIAL